MHRGDPTQAVRQPHFASARVRHDAICIWVIPQDRIVSLILLQCLRKAIQNMRLGSDSDIASEIQGTHLRNRTEAIRWPNFASMCVKHNSKHSSGRSHSSNSLA